MLFQLIKQIIINAVITLVIAAVMFYIMLPPVTLHSKLFVTYLAIVLVIFAVLCYGRTLLQGKLPFEGGFKVGPAEIALIGAAAVVALTAVIGWIGSTKIFHASRYQSMLNVETGDFAEEVEEIDFDQIPMLDLMASSADEDPASPCRIDSAAIGQFAATPKPHWTLRGEPTRF